MSISLKLNDSTLIAADMNECKDVVVRNQLAYMLARQLVYLDPSWLEESSPIAPILSNSRLSHHFLSVARNIDVLEPKTPEELYKTHLEQTRSALGSSMVDSARQNCASSIVNGFLNCGFGQDKLILTAEDSSSFIYKNKDEGLFAAVQLHFCTDSLITLILLIVSGIMSATASLGLISLWDVDGGLGKIDRFLYSTDVNVKAGAHLAIGLMSVGVRNESDPALALLSEHVSSGADALVRIASILGLGIAYAGTGLRSLQP